MLKPYPGDGHEKRVARAIMYCRISYLWGATQPPTGKYITLVGEGAEINLFRYFLKIDAKEAVFVDKVHTLGLDKAEAEWKHAAAVKDNVLTYLRGMKDEIAFINLDFMGHFKIGVTDKILYEVAKRLAPGGAVAFTFTRGHENEKQACWKFLKTHAISDVKKTNRSLTTNKSLLRDEIRFRGYRHWIEAILGVDTVTVLKLKYSRMFSFEGGNRHGKGMGIILFQKVPPDLRTSAWLKRFRTHLFNEEATGRVSNVGIQDKVRGIINWGTQLGLEAKELGGLLNLKPTTVGAYKANASRPTNKKKIAEVSVSQAPALTK